jgi:hypothetical protein
MQDGRVNRHQAMKVHADVQLHLAALLRLLRDLKESERTQKSEEGTKNSGQGRQSICVVMTGGSDRGVRHVNSCVRRQQV